MVVEIESVQDCIFISYGDLYIYNKFRYMIALSLAKLETDTTVSVMWYYYNSLL